MTERDGGPWKATWRSMTPTKIPYALSVWYSMKQTTTSSSTASWESWTMPEYTVDLLSCWIRRGGSKSQKRWWKIVPACIW
ncbi:hypothetical protein H5410_029767 [Solanum commersonii]|uniref:Uncharacterized protein n=1 Tax=Solanum commersonii TaxID=4109 RepID=A0A9J5YE66_SOLCO|nr:hypothetical protein H5410_029767 [Solanum commersonii]